MASTRNESKRPTKRQRVNRTDDMSFSQPEKVQQQALTDSFVSLLHAASTFLPLSRRDKRDIAAAEKQLTIMEKMNAVKSLAKTIPQTKKSSKKKVVKKAEKKTKADEGKIIVCYNFLLLFVICRTKSSLQFCKQKVYKIR